MAIDLERVARAALDGYLGGPGARPSRSRDAGGRDRHSRLGGVGAVAVGVGLGLAGRAALRRVRRVDLEQVGESIEDKLQR